MSKPKFTIEELTNIVNGKLLKITGNKGSFGVSTDTRTIEENDFYIPLVGENFDGHKFIEDAVNKNCAGILISKSHPEKIFRAPNIIEVEDTKEAYLKIANFYRRKINPKVVAITGSSGKTTTKEMVFAVLNTQFKTQKSLLNHNNEIGLCQTLLNIEEDTEIVIVEMGMRGLGEIELLSKYAEPDVAIVTNVGTSHIGRLGSRENIAKAKCEIAKFLNKDGTFIGMNDDLLKSTLDFDGEKIFFNLKNVENIEVKAEGSKFTYKNQNYFINETGEYNILNALVAIETGLKFNIPPAKIQQGLLNFQNVQYRNEVKQLKNGAILINDCYNANPDSARVSIKATSDIYKDREFILVFGDMFELGEFEEFYHREIGKFIENTNVNYFVAIGNLVKMTSEEVKTKNKIHFENTEDAVNFLQTIINENSVILFKASRGMAFEKIIRHIEEL